MRARCFRSGYRETSTSAKTASRLETQSASAGNGSTTVVLRSPLTVTLRNSPRLHRGSKQRPMLIGTSTTCSRAPAKPLSRFFKQAPLEKTGKNMPEADSEGQRFQADQPQRAPGFFLKGSHQLDWGMKNRLARTFNPATGRTVMLAIDHGYFQGPTTGLERIRSEERRVGKEGRSPGV